MKREVVLLVLGVFLMVFMIGGVSANIFSSYRENYLINNYSSVNAGNCMEITGLGYSNANNKISIKEICFNLKDLGFGGIDYFSGYTAKGLTYSWITYYGPNGGISFQSNGSVYSAYNAGISHTNYLGGNLHDISKDSSTEMFVNLIKSEGNSFYIGKIQIIFQNRSDGLGLIILDGIMVNDEIITSLEKNQSSQNKRISALESWQLSIETLVPSIPDSISLIVKTLGEFNTRITTLENKSVQNNTIVINNTIISNSSLPNYFKYLSSSDRKVMVCGYGIDNNLTSINDIGFNCTITYKTNQYTKKVTSTCKCSGK